MMTRPSKLAGERMYEPTQDATWAHSIDLAQEVDFNLGPLRVRPARCEVEWKGIPQTLQRRVMQVLVALVQARGSVVSQNDLVIRCWRGLSVSDDAIYRCIGKLRKLAADYPDAPYAIEAIPGVGYRLTSPSIVETAAPGESRFRLRALAAAAGVILLLMIGAAFWMSHRSTPGDRPLSVAVQPFEALSASEDARSLARRIPNEVVDVLGDSQIETVLASERTTTASLAPSLIVTGIVRDDGRTTVVDLRLEDGPTRAALWSTEFKADRREASDMPLEVAARVADAVNMIDFARNANPPLTDDSALTALIQANDMLRGASDEGWAPTLQKAQDIVSRHPEFAFGHSILAAAYSWAADNVPDRAQAMRDAARREANLTLKLDAEDAGAYAVLSGLVAPYDHPGREAIFVRGIRLAKHPKQPLAALYSYYGLFLGDVGRLREALSAQLVAHATDEWGPARTTKLANSYASIGNRPAARATIRKAVQFWPNHPGVWKWQQFIAGFYEQPTDALEVFRQLDARPSLRESDAVWRSFILAKATGSEEAAKAAAIKIREAADEATITREHEIMMLAGLGDTKAALDAANSALDRHPLEPWFLFTPVARNLRQDRGFVLLASRMGLIKYWRETGKRPDFCTGPRARSECSPQLLAQLK
jgi:DNA-binding winged helix-turn-helix (wHTH) protein/TolB-like protein/tetratricopeptide (TPR) repeat protein